MPYRRGGFALTPPSLVIFLISLVLAAVNVPSTRINLLALGLSFWVLALIVA